MIRTATTVLVASLLSTVAFAQTPPASKPPTTPPAAAASAPAATTAKPPAPAATTAKPAAAPASSASSVEFKDEASAKAHCPTDTVVWLIPRSKVYHLSGNRYYGTTKKGVYICKQDADHLGARVARGEVVKTPAAPATTKP